MFCPCLFLVVVIVIILAVILVVRSHHVSNSKHHPNDGKIDVSRHTHVLKTKPWPGYAPSSDGREAAVNLNHRSVVVSHQFGLFPTLFGINLSSTHRRGLHGRRGGNKRMGCILATGGISLIVSFYFSLSSLSLFCV